ncbi:Nickel import system ATP-binding protein NikE [Providencia alcalifaciens]|uniref:ATP-binding cassette domain-containing protein n=1 Tax=Providencia TaxID=586 RepID=UPI00029C5725|nr:MULTISPECIES: ATP-binding cassette domain-containing protein [Providencia]EKT64169.1 nickel/di-oligopepetide ABC transporter ATP-binding protein [Providencia alcalifaciens Dmel2]ETT04031.1 ABC transporter, ATP-binding protein [Providencia alcalifaciens F90-2004]EUC95836.1 ABC transporter, ATP-binding protein [Providencia alcalifaciens PAL-2]EUD01970.1 ABC transporter, ATP-binding protein [Providencia alcalifaciens RIMD 1656011]MTB32960.1 ATP-binding cassette domain-containing protein [Provi
MLEIQNLRIEQAGRVLWDNLNLSLVDNERLGISAPSGFGKTTLGRVLGQWQKPTDGQVLLNGEPVPHRGYCPIQLVPQHPEKSFNPYRTVGSSVRDAWEPDAQWLDWLSIKPQWLERRPSELSGGELARIALLRALDPRTQVLIADEMTAQLDAHLQKEVWQHLIRISQQRPLAMIVFSHNKALLEKVCTKVWTVAEA